MKANYVVRPRADRDIEEQAFYYATEGNLELGHRFLLAVHETFQLLATQPNMGWHAKLRIRSIAALRVFRVTGFEKILILYLPQADGVEIVRLVHGTRNLLALL